MLTLADTSLLVVEDDADNRDLLAFVLQNQGAKVIAVDSASAALEILEQVRPDAVLSDLSMPDRNGYSLIRDWRARETELGLSSIPFIAVTASAKDQDKQRALNTGFQLHISKPFDIEHLPQLVITVITDGVRPTLPRGS